MKKLLFLVFVLGLGLSSCKKDEIQPPEEKVTINGKEYSKILIYNLMSYGLGVPQDELIFNQDTETFSLIGRDVNLSPLNYMDLSQY